MNENKMAVMPVRRLLLNMSWPMMLSMLIQGLYNLVDSMFVAKLSGDSFVALSLVYPVQTLMIAICVGVGVGFNALLSRRLGEGRREEAEQVTSNGYFLYLVCWLVFLILGVSFARPFLSLFSDVPQVVTYGSQYLAIVTGVSLGMCMQFAGERTLQATGNTIGPMIIQGIGAVINLVLDPLLIFGIGPFPRLEVAGAAIATVLGQLVGMVVGLIMVRRTPSVTLSFRGFRPNASILADMLRVGIPAALMQALTTVMSMGMNLILPLFTSAGVFILGAYFKLQSFLFMPLYGMNNAIVPIISFNYGARKKERITGTIRFALALTLGIMAVGTVVMMTLSGPLLGIFDADAAVLAEGIPALRMIALSFLYAGVSIILCSALQALGAANSSLAISLLRQVVLLLPAALVLGAIRPVLVWLAFPVAELISCAAALILCRNILRRKLDGMES
ncbi:MATE family efflux transporter [Flavonifractor sp. HCP28S3_F3]|uniref:MATE family efflux transporter n=1 Tax=Flavonifractor sp. HCP28S3_F3 TaxID=3438939 RepID=UPI003F894B3A